MGRRAAEWKVLAEALSIPTKVFLVNVKIHRQSGARKKGRLRL